MALPTFNMPQLKGETVDLTTVGTYTTHETEPEGELTTIVEIPNKQELHKKPKLSAANDTSAKQESQTET